MELSGAKQAQQALQTFKALLFQVCLSGANCKLFPDSVRLAWMVFKISHDLSDHLLLIVVWLVGWSWALRRAQAKSLHTGRRVHPLGVSAYLSVETASGLSRTLWCAPQQFSSARFCLDCQSLSKPSLEGSQVWRVPNLTLLWFDILKSQWFHDVSWSTCFNLLFVSFLVYKGLDLWLSSVMMETTWFGPQVVFVPMKEIGSQSK